MGCTLDRTPNAEPCRDDQALVIGSYTLERKCKLAQGAFGSLWQCKCVSSGILYAVKEMYLKDKEIAQSYEQEVALLVLIASIQAKLKEHSLQGAINMKAYGVHTTKKHNRIGRILFELGTTTLFD
jgi:hypothetical protein